MPRSRIRLSLLAALLLASCTDSQLDGVPRIDLDGYAETDGTLLPDTEVDTSIDVDPAETDGTVLPETDIVDVEIVDVDVIEVDTAEVDTVPDVIEVEAGCFTNEQCRAIVGPIGACQDPVCDGGVCRVAQRPDCCASNNDCPRLDDPCLSNRCPVPGGGCVALNICNPCQTANDCNSNDPCTIGSCGADGECVYTRNPACDQCQSDQACDDGVVCTKDACIGGRCLHEPTPGCCSQDIDCRDQDPCTRDFCRPGSGLCGFEQIPGCGECTPELCDDFDPCTQDLCTDIGCTHISDPDCRACQGNGQCNDGDICTRDQCANGRCFYSPATGPDGAPLCGCDSADQCDDNDPCTQDFCDGQQCINFPDPTIPECNACGGSTCDDFDPCTIDFCDGFNCQHQAVLGLPGCEERCQTDMDCGQADMCSKSFCDMNTFTCTTISIPDCCQGDDMCNDFDPCTEDACIADGRCIHREVPGCGNCEQFCDDGDPCTQDQCFPDTGECFFIPLPGCFDECDSNDDCEDTSRCTRNTCVSGTCEVAAIPNCCNNNNDCRDGNPCTNAFCQDQSGTCIISFTDCDDGNPCTRDSCDANSGGCISVPDPASPECRCEPQVLWERHFIGGETPDINIDGSGFGVRWQVDDVRSSSPSQSLRYGDDEGDDYDTNFRTFGRATGPTLDVPFNARRVTLEFNVYMDIDEDPSRDSLRARVLFGDNRNEIVWDRVWMPRMNDWVPVQAELPSEVIGQEIQIRFVFDSLDGEGNDGQGVFIDDIVVRSVCQ